MIEMKYWDIGEADLIHPSKDKLYRIMNALILCKGIMTCTDSGEIQEAIYFDRPRKTFGGMWAYPTVSCAVVFRIALPLGCEDHFQNLSGCTLTEIPQISGN